MKLEHEYVFHRYFEKEQGVGYCSVAIERDGTFRAAINFDSADVDLHIDTHNNSHTADVLQMSLTDTKVFYRYLTNLANKIIAGILLATEHFYLFRAFESEDITVIE